MADMEKDIDLDATLVHATYVGLLEAALILLGLTDDEVIARIQWLVKQDDDYVNLVAEKVKEMARKRDT